MRTKLFISILFVLLLLSGCQSGGSSTGADNPTQPPVSETPGDNPGDENPGEDNPGNENPTNPPVVKEADGWYMRTTAKVVTADNKVYTHKSAGVFGALEESSDEKDQHDIKAFGQAALYVVFPQEDWNDDNGDYFSDYRHYTKGSMERQVWTFQVKNETTDPDLSNASLTLALEGPYKVYKKKEGVGYDEEKDTQSPLTQAIHLVDVDNDKEYTYAELQNLQLSMEGKKVRTFRWVLGTVYPEDYEDLAVKVTTNSLKVQSEEPEREPETKFGFPPAI